MPTGDGWYLLGPLIAVGLVGFLGAVFWRMGLQWTHVREPESPADRLALFQDGEYSGELADGDRPGEFAGRLPRDLPDADFAVADHGHLGADPGLLGADHGVLGADYGLLGAAAVTDAPEAADEVRRLLAEAGIRSTRAIGRNGRTAVLVFHEELAAARRLVGDSPSL